MPTLLQIDTCLNTGSTGRITEAIGRMANQIGWNCFIIHGARYANPPSCMKSYQTVTKIGEYLHYAEGLFLDNHGLSSRHATRKAIDWIKVIKPDVIHLHCIHGYYLNYRLLFEYLNSAHIPVVWTFHDCWAFTGHCAYFDRVACEKWKTGCKKCPLINDYPKALLDASERNYKFKKDLFTQNRRLHIVTVSKWLESLVRQSFLQSANIQTIYNGIDINTFKPSDSESLRAKLGLKGERVLLAAATVWAERKGFADYIKLSRVLRGNTVIILLGLNDSQMSSLPENVIGLKRTESVAELAQYYSMADVVLNLSYEETFGLTTAEGMACGTPGIVYNTTASPELITPETGIIVDSGDIDGLSKAVQIMLSKEKPVDACRKRAVNYFNKEDRFQEYIDLYEVLVKQ